MTILGICIVAHADPKMRRRCEDEPAAVASLYFCSLNIFSDFPPPFICARAPCVFLFSSTTSSIWALHHPFMIFLPPFHPLLHLSSHPFLFLLLLCIPLLFPPVSWQLSFFPVFPVGVKHQSFWFLVTESPRSFFLFLFNCSWSLPLCRPCWMITGVKSSSRNPAGNRCCCIMQQQQLCSNNYFFM